MQTGEEPDGSEDGGQKDQRKEETKSKPKRAAPDMCGGAVVFLSLIHIWRAECSGILPSASEERGMRRRWKRKDVPDSRTTSGRLPDDPDLSLIHI